MKLSTCDVLCKCLLSQWGVVTFGGHSTRTVLCKCLPSCRCWGQQNAWQHCVRCVLSSILDFTIQVETAKNSNTSSHRRTQRALGCCALAIETVQILCMVQTAAMAERKQHWKRIAGATGLLKSHCRTAHTNRNARNTQTTTHPFMSRPKKWWKLKEPCGRKHMLHVELHTHSLNTRSKSTNTPKSRRCRPLMLCMLCRYDAKKTGKKRNKSFPAGNLHI